MKTAIIFGASGFIGSFLLTELLNSDEYHQVTVVVRKKIPVEHTKLNVLIGDLHSLPGLKDNIKADEIFICLGTTKKNTPDEKQYYRIDHDYPVMAAKMIREAGGKSVFLVSSVGANAQSGVFYIRTKGETERDILALDFDHTHIFRPSMLMGSRQEKRPLERFLIGTFSVVNKILIGKTLKKYRGIEGLEVAKAMVNAAQKQSEKIKIYQWQEMKSLQ